MTLLDTPPLDAPGLSSTQFVARLHNAALAIETPELPAETLEFTCQRIVKQGYDYKLVPKGELRLLRSRTNQRPGKLGRSKEWASRDPKELLTELLTPGSDVYGAMLDADVWATALRYCRDSNAQPEQTMTLSRGLNYFLISRAGGTIEASRIP